MLFIAVDNEPFALSDIADTIREAAPEAELREFGSPGAALEFASRNRIDIAFLDIRMPGMSGLELAKRLKDLNPKTNIVFVTGYTQYKGGAMDLRASGYLLKPVSKEAVERELENLRHPVERKSDKRLRVQTFGNFEVFVDGKPLLFKFEKTKELLAYLVHRKGAILNNSEIMAVIWEGRKDTLSLKSQFRNLVADLTGTLKEAGLPDMVIKKYGYTGITADEIMCDYYDFLEGIPYAVNSYKKEYMAQFAWAEFTNADLSG